MQRPRGSEQFSLFPAADIDGNMLKGVFSSTNKFDYSGMHTLPVIPEPLKDLTYLQNAYLIDPTETQRPEDVIQWEWIGGGDISWRRFRVGVATERSENTELVLDQLPNNFAYRQNAKREEAAFHHNRICRALFVEFVTDGYDYGDFRIYQALVKPRARKTSRVFDGDGEFAYSMPHPDVEELPDILGTSSIEKSVEHLMFMHWAISGIYEHKIRQAPNLFLSTREGEDPNGNRRAEFFYDIVPRENTTHGFSAPVTSRPLRQDESNIGLHLLLNEPQDPEIVKDICEYYNRQLEKGRRRRDELLAA